MRLSLACVVIGLFFLTAPEVKALVGIDGKCMDACEDRGTAYAICREQCDSRPDAPAAITEPTFHLDCAIKCQNQGNTRELCKSLCTY